MWPASSIVGLLPVGIWSSNHLEAIPSCSSCRGVVETFRGSGRQRHVRPHQSSNFARSTRGVVSNDLLPAVSMSSVVYRLVHPPVTRESGVRLPARETYFSLFHLIISPAELFYNTLQCPYNTQGCESSQSETLSTSSAFLPETFSPLLLKNALSCSMTS